jgi:riboflavin kinase/FMN adenylyltransferase
MMRVIDWEDFTAQNTDSPSLALTVGVFDGVHRGHQVLIRRICASPYLPTVVTFTQNPLKILQPRRYPGDIFSLEQKLRALELMGAAQAVLIDFSQDFSRMNGRDFIDLLLKGGRTKFLALGRNFRCGRGQDFGAPEFAARAAARGVEVWIAEPVMEGGSRISSSRIRQAIARGDFAGASLLLGRPYEPRP